jgi:magnesium-protoporphyrin O-methyltransferase
MNCCALEGTNKFFNKQARHMEKYFKKKGLRKEQKYLAEGICQGEMNGAEILEIGCGVGALHLSLLKEGAAKVIGFDISEKMIQTARRLSAEMGLHEHTNYMHGDFTAMHERAPAADITILDKVICCYENAPELIARSTGKTKRIYAVSYPRASTWVRWFFQIGIFVFKLIRHSFHPYYHSPALVQQWITNEGFEKTYERETFMWLVQIYQRRLEKTN